MPIKNNWPGPKSVALFQEEQKHIAPGLQTIALTSQLAIEKGEGSYVVDLDGNRYLDLNVGVSVGSLGHAHPEMIKALSDQIATHSIGSFTSRARTALLKQISQMTPRGLTRTQLFSSGAEAVEAAFRLAKSVTKKSHLFGLTGGYHGKTAGTLPLSHVEWKEQVGPYPPGYHQAPYADCYRCPLQLTYPSCGIACAEELRKQIKTEAMGQVAAVIAEPVQGTSGNVVPPDGYIAAIREITREADALFISDEMITGFGRTGTAFGVDHDGVTPDILTIGKAMGGGFPISGVVTTDALSHTLPWAMPSASSSSYGGNPLASAAALTTLQTIVNDRLIDNSRRVGQILLEGLRALQNKYACIGDVRGRGLMLGMDLVKDRITKEPLSKALCEKFFTEGLKRGLIAMSYSPRVRLHPALTLTEAEARDALAILDECFDVIERLRGSDHD